MITIYYFINILFRLLLLSVGLFEIIISACGFRCWAPRQLSCILGYHTRLIDPVNGQWISTLTSRDRIVKMGYRANQVKLYEEKTARESLKLLI